MKDTDPAVEAAFTARFAERSASERVRMACDMFDAAKALIAADLRARQPDLTGPELRRAIFERLYFGDFDAATRARVLESLG